MKTKKVFSLVSMLAICLLSLAVMGCTSVKEFSVDYDVDTEYPNDDVEVIMTVGGMGGLLNGDGIMNFNVSVKNNTDKMIKINFAESSLSYKNKTCIPFIDGEKYINAGNPPATKVVPKKGTTSFILLSSDQINFTSGKYGGWHVYAMDYVVTVSLAVEIDGKIYYWLTTAIVN